MTSPVAEHPAMSSVQARSKEDAPMPYSRDTAVIDTPLAQLVRLCLLTFEGDPVALFPITKEDQAWRNSAVAYLARQKEGP